MIKLSSALIFAACVTPFCGHGQALDLPRLSISDLSYQGAFRVPAGEFGASNMNYAQGPIEYHAGRHALYMVGHGHEQAIAEFAVPALSLADSLGGLNMASDPMQVFAPVLDRAPSGNTESINRIGGLELVATAGGMRLVVNAYEYYDAPADNTHSTLILDNADDLANSAAEGYVSFQGGAGHTSGWMSPIPSAWQSVLGGTHVTGHASGIPINGRSSIGPSAFAFDADDLLNATAATPDVATNTLLDFTLANRLHDDLENTSGTNSLWTHLSHAVYGVIVPGTRTYLTVGRSGGHSSGVCYKCTQDNGNLCGGYCSRTAADNYQYYWLWDVKDFDAVRRGELQPHEVLPYEYGEFSTPFATQAISGGTFDPPSGLLYITIDRADREQGTYANPPVVLAYSLTDGPADALFANGFE